MGLPQEIAQWWPHLVAAGKAHSVDPHLLAAIMHAESRGGLWLVPPGAGGTGDGGHGRGLMQIDDRSHAEWLLTHDWRDAWLNTNMGAEIFREALDAFAGDVEPAVCAYNAGVPVAAKALAKLPDDATTEQRRAALDRVTAPPHRYVSVVMDAFRRFTQGATHA